MDKMNDFEKTKEEFDEKDIERIFGGESVLANAESSSGTESQIVRQLQEQQTVASDNLS